MTPKKLFLNLISVSIFILSFLALTSQVNAATDITGWGWSSNTGWISLNCSNHSSCGNSYKVTLATTTPSPTIGTFSGYAWSPNIGWIKFAGDGTHPTPSVDLATGYVSGWIRVCSGTIKAGDPYLGQMNYPINSPQLVGDCSTNTSRPDGWDGWINLAEAPSATFYPTGVVSGTKGITYNPTDGYFKGYSWGSVNVGWLTFSPSLLPGGPPGGLSPTTDVKCAGCGSSAPPGQAPTVTLTANPMTVYSGQSSDLTWTTTNVGSGSCVASGDWSGTKSSTGGTETRPGITTAKTYTIICTNNDGTDSDTVNVGIAGASPDIKLFLGSDLSTYDMMSPVEMDSDKVVPYTIKKGKTFNMRWISNSTLSGYSCYPLTTKESDGSDANSVISWNSSHLTSGNQDNIPTSNVDPGLYDFELECQKGSPAVYKSSNVVKLKLINSAIIEER